MTLILKIVQPFLFAAAGVLFFSCKSGSPNPAQNHPSVPVLAADVLVLHAEPFSHIIEASGTVIADQYVELKPETSGRITSLHVPEGQAVKAGTVIATIYNEDLKAQLEKDQAILDIDEKTEGRLKQLIAVNGINQQDYDNAVAQVNSTKADLDYVNAEIKKTIISAPFDGIIGLRNVSLGALVSPTDVITTLQQLNNLKIDFTLPDNYANSVGKNDRVFFILDASNFKYRGHVLAIEPQANIDTRNIKVRAVLDTVVHINPGAFAKVYVETASDQNALLVPSYAIIPESDNNKVVLVKGGKAAFANVVTGTRTNGWVEITKGVGEGDTLLVSGTLFAKQGAPIKIATVETKADIERSTDVNQAAQNGAATKSE